MRTVVVIPTYNEIDNIDAAVSGVRYNAPEADILIADDNSPDGTGRRADELAAVDGHVHVLHRQGKQGLGAAYLAGFEWAKQHGYEAVVEMDADGSHRAVDLPLLLDRISDADVVLGSRWIKGGKVVNWPLQREILSRGGNLYTRMWLGMPVSDATGGFRVLRMSALEKIGLDGVQSQGYCFQVDLVWRASQLGLRIVEVPITFVERTAGVSKMDNSIVKEAMLMVAKWGIAKRRADLARLISGRAS